MLLSRYITTNNISPSALIGFSYKKGAFDLEVTLRDDCSTDKTRQIMHEYTEKHPDTFVLIPPTANMGATKNIKRCLDTCSGDYIAFCEGDDYWIDRYK